MPDYTPTKTKALSTLKSLRAESANLNPSAVITLFELDLTSLMKANEIVDRIIVVSNHSKNTYTIHQVKEL